MHCEWSLSVPASLTLPHSNLLNEWKQSNYNLLKNYKPGNKCIPSLHQYTSSPSFTTPWSFAYSTPPWNSSIAIPSENCFQFIPRHQLKELKDNNNVKQTIHTDNTFESDYNFGITVITVTILKNKKVTQSNRIMIKNYYDNGGMMVMMIMMALANWIPSFLGIPKNSQKLLIMQITLANWIPSFLGTPRSSQKLPTVQI